MKRILVNASPMWLVYRDAEGNQHFQSWGELTEAGTLIDPESGDDMELYGWTQQNPNTI